MSCPYMELSPLYLSGAMYATSSLPVWSAAALPSGFMPFGRVPILRSEFATGTPRKSTETMQTPPSTKHMRLLPRRTCFRDTESPNRLSVSREWPIGRAVWLAGSVTPKTLGLPGTWKSYRWSLTTKVGSVLDVKDGRYDVAGAEVQIYSYNNSEAQRWHIYAEGPGVVTLWVRTA